MFYIIFPSGYSQLASAKLQEMFEELAFLCREIEFFPRYYINFSLYLSY